MTQAMTDKRVDTLLQCAELLKEIVNASDGDRPWSGEECVDEAKIVLEKVYRSGVSLKGEG